MKGVSLVLPYYDNPGMLAMQYKSILELPDVLREQVHMVIVDDGSPNHPAYPMDLKGAGLQIYRVDVDIRWNQDAARNIGAHHAETNWLMFTDMDHLVPLKTWGALIARDLDAANVYQFGRVSAPELEPYKHHPNSWFMDRKMWDKIGGYDERLAGLYGTDADFRDSVRKHADIVQLKEVLVRVPRTLVPDASTTTYLRKQPEDRAGMHARRAARPKGWRPLTLQCPYHRLYPVADGTTGEAK